jgi:hypothetical protein
VATKILHRYKQGYCRDIKCLAKEDKWVEIGQWPTNSLNSGVGWESIKRCNNHVLATGGEDLNTASSDQQEQDATGTTEVNVVIAGTPGAGKSTLARSILGFKVSEELPPTEKCDTLTNTRHGIAVNIIDTVGLGTRKEKRKRELKKMYQHTRGHANLLVYCVPVNLGSRLDCINPAIMKSLQSAYGKEIWKHCVIVFTFSNMILNHFKSTEEEVDTIEAKYKSHLLKYTTQFKEELEKLKNKDFEIKPVVDFETEGTPENPIATPIATPAGYEADGTTTILALPAGYKQGDEVYLNFQRSKFENPYTHQLEKIDETDWRDILLIAMAIKCSKIEPKKNLLQYRYGKDLAKSLFMGGGTLGGMVGGAAIGAGTGALLCLFGGPLGIGVGAMAGAVIGGTTGAVGGRVGGGVIGKVQSKK